MCIKGKISAPSTSLDAISGVDKLQKSATLIATELWRHLELKLMHENRRDFHDRIYVEVRFAIADHGPAAIQEALNAVKSAVRDADLEQLTLPRLAKHTVTTSRQ